VSEKPWYHAGLKFTCSQCGDCCSGAPGYVWVNQDEIDGMGKILGLTSDEFERKFVRKVGIRRSLTEYPDGDCILLDPQTRKCTVYESRPRQCRTWPFWDSNLKTEADWQRTCEVCPGSGQGKLHSIEKIEASRKVFRV